MRRTSGTRLASLVVTMVLFGAACTGGTAEEVAGPDATAGGTPTPTSTDELDVPLATETPVFPEGASVLRVAIPEPATLDPMRIGDPGSVLIVRQLFEGLTRWDPSTEEVVPAAAESWSVKNSGRSWTFTLRRGMTFHNGTAVTAEDFKFAFDRIALRRNASDIAYTLERVKGFLDANQLGDAKHLSGVKVADDYTLRIDLDEPFYDLPAVLTHPGLVPVPEKAVEKTDQFLSFPVGNGPFQMATPWTAGTEVALERFDGASEAPVLDGLRFIPFSDASESWLLFRDDAIDVSEVPIGQFESAAEEFGDDGYQPFLAGYYYGFNLDAKALRDRRIRKAVNLGIDREQISEDIYGGSLIPPRGIVPEGMPGFEDDICSEFCRSDPAAASALVRKLPKKKRSIALDFTRGVPHREVALEIKNDLEEVGFDIKVKGYGFESYLKKLRDGDHRFFRFGWIAEFPAPGVFLSSLFEGESPDNQTAYQDQKVDALLRKAHAEKDPDKRLELYLRAEKKILAEIPVVPIGSFMIHWVAQPEVEGLEFDVMGGFDAVGISLGE